MLARNKLIYWGTLFTIFLVPVIFSTRTTETFGLIKTVTALGLSSILVFLVFSFQLSLTGLLFSAFIAWAGLSLLWAQSPMVGLLSVQGLLSYFFIYLLAGNIFRNKQRMLSLFRVVVVAGVASCLVDAWFNHGFGFDSGRMNHLGSFGHPNFFAQYLILALPLAIALAMEKRDAIARLGWGLSGLVLAGYFLLTRSRAAWLAVAVAVLILLVVLVIEARRRKNKNFTVKKILTTSTVILLVLASVFIFPKNTNKWLRSSKDSIARIINADVYDSSFSRSLLWREALSIVKDYPVLGVGIGNFKVKLPPYRTPRERQVAGSGFGFSKAHNEYLQILAELGPIGLVIFMLMLFSIFKTLLSKRELVTFSLIVALVSAAGHAVFSSNFQIPASAFTFWALAGAVSGYADKDKIVFKPKIILLIPGFILLVVILLTSGYSLSSDVYYQQSKVAKQKGDIEEAINLGRRSVTRNPHNVKAVFNQAALCYQAGEFKNSELNYLNALRLYPNHDIIWNNLGALYIKMGRLADARAALEKALQINPDNQDAQRNLGFL